MTDGIWDEQAGKLGSQGEPRVTYFVTQRHKVAKASILKDWCRLAPSLISEGPVNPVLDRSETFGRRHGQTTNGQGTESKGSRMARHWAAGSEAGWMFEHV